MSERITLQGRKVYHGSWFWKCQHIVTWPYGFGPVVRGYIMVGVCAGRNLLMVARKQRERRGCSSTIPSKHTYQETSFH